MDLPSMPSAISRIRTHINALSPSERRVADYICAHRAEVVNMTMMDIADTIDVSDATVLRFVRSVGFEGFSAFKTALTAEMMLPSEAVFETVSQDDTYDTVIHKVINSDITLLQETLGVLSPTSLKETVEAIESAKNIYIFSVASSEPMAVWLYDRMFRLGYTVIAITDTYRQFVQASIAKPDDLFIVVSRSGSPTTIADAMRTIKRTSRETKIVSIVCDETSRVAMRSDICLCCVSNEIRTDVVGSIVSMASVLNVLYTCLERINIDRTVANQKAAWEALALLRKYDK